MSAPIGVPGPVRQSSSFSSGVSMRSPSAGVSLSYVLFYSVQLTQYSPAGRNRTSVGQYGRRRFEVRPDQNAERGVHMRPQFLRWLLPTLILAIGIIGLVPTNA